MILDIVFLLLGLGLILWGANLLTDGASALAMRMGVSDLVIGLTVVAFGTSAPELVISMTAAFQGSAGMAVGNVVGSNIFNVLVIIGVTALVSPIKIQRSIMTTEIPLVILSAAALWIMANDTLLNGAADNIISRTDGLILLLFFVVFMRHTFSMARETPHPSTDPAAESAAARKPLPTWRSILYVAGGLAFLLYGGDRFVSGASGIARAIGISDAVIGLTIVACGTSLPELATSVTAALKHQTGIAIGNVIGSNIFNIFLVLGATSAIRQLPLGGITELDLLVLLGSCTLFWITGQFYRTRCITRIEGGIMAVLYTAYTCMLIILQ